MISLVRSLVLFLRLFGRRLDPRNGQAALRFAAGTTQEYMSESRKLGRSHPNPHQSEEGYILIMLMLFVALLAIAAAALAPTLAFQVRRDREEEMIHRGVQYSRAIRRYVKKTGRYPTRLEELENTNNIRFLRKRYKDPITGKDFKLLHVGEVQLASAAGIAGATSITGAAPLGASASAAAAVLGGARLPGSMMAASTGGAANSLLGAEASQPASAGTVASTTGGGGTSDNSGQDINQANSASGEQSKADQSQSGSQDKLSSQVFGGGPIVGVASTSKAQSIREFNHKNHYDKWQFIYDPTMDRGGLIKTPAQPALQVAAPIQQQNSSNSPGGLQGSSPPPAQPTQQQQQ